MNMTNKELIEVLKAFTPQSVRQMPDTAWEAMQDAIAALEAQEWQPIETAPPFDNKTKVLVIGGRFLPPDAVMADGDHWRLNKGKLSAIPTHWKPLDTPEE